MIVVDIPALNNLEILKLFPREIHRLVNLQLKEEYKGATCAIQEEVLLQILVIFFSKMLKQFEQLRSHLQLYF
jgi:hypothetical protein